jgi:hypothetical protein
MHATAEIDWSFAAFHEQLGGELFFSDPNSVRYVAQLRYLLLKDEMSFITAEGISSWKKDYQFIVKFSVKDIK